MSLSSWQTEFNNNPFCIYDQGSNAGDVAKVLAEDDIGNFVANTLKLSWLMLNCSYLGFGGQDLKFLI